MRALIIDEEARGRIARALERARTKVIPWSELKDYVNSDLGTALGPTVVRLKDRRGTPKRDPEQVFLEQGYRCAVTFEEQPEGIIKHVSVSVDTPGRVPNPPAIQMLAMAFNFRVPINLAHIWLEEFEPGHMAVNMVEKVDG